MPFRDQRVLLTGGAGGLGSLLADELMRSGADLTIVDRVDAAPAGAAYVRGDLSTSEGIESVAAAVAPGDWNVLVNLAGIQHFGPFEAQSAAHLHASYMVNLVAPVRLSQAVLPGMRRRGAGQIVNIGSIFGSINFAHFVTYSSAKAGLRGFSQALRRELAGSGVSVTHIAPRAVRTPLNSAEVLRFAELTGMNMDEPDRVALKILDAIIGRKRDVYIGFPESLFVRVNALVPGLVDRALAGKDRKAGALFSA